jgi:hypothetical protein
LRYGEHCYVLESSQEIFKGHSPFS